MSLNANAVFVPLPAFQHDLLAVATGLRSSRSGIIDVIDLKPRTACRNAITLLRYASARLDLAVNILGPFALVGYGLYKYVWQGLSLPAVIEWVTSHFVSRITIPADHPLNGIICHWVVKQGLHGDARNLTLDNTIDLSKTDINGDAGHDESGLTKSRKSRMIYEYLPAVGTTDFYFNHTSFQLTRVMLPKREHGKSQQYSETYNPPPPNNWKYETRGGGRSSQPTKCEIEISCFSPFAGVRPIKELIRHISQLNYAKREKQTTIMRPRNFDGHPEWDMGTTRPARTLQSVTMDSERKADIVTDISKYLSTESQKWYSERGIPWRRGYLFYGPPGTGKTSFCTALAGHFSLIIYVISLSDIELDDKKLENLFEFLPNRCIVLLEDVDSAGIERERMRTSKKGKKKRRSSSRGGGGITLSGLLNVIDGPCAKEGRVLVLTTNTPDSLDTALLRPGRIDKKVLFGHASHQVTSGLFMRTYQGVDGDQVENLETLSKIFASKIPADELTPAEIQGFLLIHRESADEAVELAENWAQTLIETKKAGKNVEDFKDQAVDTNEDKASSEAPDAAEGATREAGEASSSSSSESDYSTLGLSTRSRRPPPPPRPRMFRPSHPGSMMPFPDFGHA